MEGCEILMLRLARQPETVIFDVVGGARILRAPLTAISNGSRWRAAASVGGPLLQERSRLYRAHVWLLAG